MDFVDVVQVPDFGFNGLKPRAMVGGFAFRKKRHWGNNTVAEIVVASVCNGRHRSILNDCSAGVNTHRPRPNGTWYLFAKRYQVPIGRTLGLSAEEALCDSAEAAATVVVAIVVSAK